MVVSATVVMVKVHRGSKSTFAYTLMALSVLLGVSYIGWAFEDSIRMEVQLPDGVSYLYASSEYAFDICNYLFNLAALQRWIFAMRYLESANTSSLTETCLTPRGISWLAWSVAIIYTLA